MRTGRGDVQLYPFLISAQQRDELSDSGPDRITALGKVLQYTVDRRLDGPECRSGSFGEHINFMHLPRLEPGFPHPRSLFTTKY
jgi:hypothetical protein